MKQFELELWQGSALLYSCFTPRSVVTWVLSIVLRKGWAAVHRCKGQVGTDLSQGNMTALSVLSREAALALTALPQKGKYL